MKYEAWSNELGIQLYLLMSRLSPLSPWHNSYYGSFCFPGFSFGAEAIVTGELARYFDKCFSTANAIACVGVSSGVMILPILTQHLINVYGWRGTMLILGGVNLHCIAAGALLRPNHDAGNPFGSTPSDSKNIALIKTSAYADEQDNPLVAKIIYYLDLHLFLDPIFLTRVVYTLGDSYCFTGWLIYLVPFAMDNGIQPYKAALLATCGGIGNLLSRFIFPFIIQIVSNECVIYCIAIANCIAFALYPVFSVYHVYAGFILCSILFGVGTGIGDLANSQIAKESIDADKMTNAFMWLFVAYSVGSVISGFLCGMYYYTILFGII